MARSLSDFIDAELKKLRRVHANIERAKAEELVYAVQVYQKHAPRGKWKKRRRPGHVSLFRSIKINAKSRTPYVYSDHPGTDVLDEGGVVRSGGRWMPVPIKGRTIPFGKSRYLALPERKGQRIIVRRSELRSRRGRERSEKGTLTIYGVFKRRVVIPRTGWQGRAYDETIRARRDEVIADKILQLDERAVRRG